MSLNPIKNYNPIINLSNQNTALTPPLSIDQDMNSSFRWEREFLFSRSEEQWKSNNMSNDHLAVTVLNLKTWALLPARQAFGRRVPIIYIRIWSNYFIFCTFLAFSEDTYRTLEAVIFFVSKLCVIISFSPSR
jgi:hypothetical protein